MNAKEILDKTEKQESFLLANDGQYLGKLCLNKYDIDSVTNDYGFYGSKYSTTSIWNQYSIYGSKYSSLSPFNQYTSTPPAIYLRGKKIGLLTKNKYLGYNNIDPDDLLEFMRKHRLNY
jgi:hypothetical protein